MILFVVFKKLVALDNRVAGSLKQGFQAGSAKNLRYEINKYLEFCIQFRLHPLPASDIQIRRFAQYIADTPTINAYGTVTNYIGAVKTYHKLMGFKPPDMQNYITSRILKGIRSQLAGPSHQARPITVETMNLMSSKVDKTSPEQVTAWTAMVFAFLMLLRKSNLVPEMQKVFDGAKQLTRGCLTLAANAVMVDVVWSKTLQYKEKILNIPLIKLRNKAICPVFWLLLMIQLNPASASDPAFCYYKGGKFMILTYPHLTYWLRKWLIMCDIDPEGYSSHSFRRGGGLLSI